MSKILLFTLLTVLFIQFALGNDEKRVLLIAGGGPSTTEVLNLSGEPTSCEHSVPDLPVYGIRATGGTSFMHGNDPVFCSGHTNGQCYKYKPELRVWEEFTKLTVRRSAAAKLQIGDYLLITGGHGSMDNYFNTTDFFSPLHEEFLPGPELPYPADGHCIVTVNHTHAIITGGFSKSDFDDVNFVNYTYSFDKDTERFTRLRPMKEERYQHVCGKLGDSRILVAGGLGLVPEGVASPEPVQYISSVEIFDLNTQLWSPGPPLPQPIRDAAAVQLEDTILILGGSPGFKTRGLDTIYAYDMKNNTWTLRNERLKQRRSRRSAVWELPASYLNCV